MQMADCVFVPTPQAAEHVEVSDQAQAGGEQKIGVSMSVKWMLSTS